MVPSSPKVPCSTGKMTSTAIEAERGATELTIRLSNGISERMSAKVREVRPLPSPLASTAADVVHFGIAGAQVALVVLVLAAQQPLRVSTRSPSGPLW